LAAARDVIRQRGFAATSVGEICEAAAVSKGAFFHHFGGKEELGVAAADCPSSDKLLRIWSL